MRNINMEYTFRKVYFLWGKNPYPKVEKEKKSCNGVMILKIHMALK